MSTGFQKLSRRMTDFSLELVDLTQPFFGSSVILNTALAAIMLET